MILLLPKGREAEAEVKTSRSWNSNEQHQIQTETEAQREKEVEVKVTEEKANTGRRKDNIAGSNDGNALDVVSELLIRGNLMNVNDLLFSLCIFVCLFVYLFLHI